MGAAVVGNVVASVVRVPPELMKQRVQTGAYRDMGDALVKMLASPEGPRGFYTGWSTQLGARALRCRCRCRRPCCDDVGGRGRGRPRDSEERRRPPALSRVEAPSSLFIQSYPIPSPAPSIHPSSSSSSSPAPTDKRAD